MTFGVGLASTQVLAVLASTSGAPHEVRSCSGAAPENHSKRCDKTPGLERGYDRMPRPETRVMEPKAHT